MDAAREKLAAAGCSVVVVVQAKPETLKLYLSVRDWHVPVVSDPGRVAYRAFTLPRTSWLSFLKPWVVWGYLRGMLRGYAPLVPYAEEDVLQLGGDFILDRNRKLVFAYPSVSPTDRPSVATLLKALPKPSPKPMDAEPRPDAPPVDGPPGPG